MRFVFFDNFKFGVLVDDRVFDISSEISGASLSSPQDIIVHLIANYEKLVPKIVNLSHGSGGMPVGSVRLRAPVPGPGKLLCSIKNYREQREIPSLEEPDFFLKSPASIIGPGDTVHLPEISPPRAFSHEAELAVVIKRMANKVPASKAMDYVFGYTGFIDVSARGVGNSFYLKKSFDTFGPMGPVLVTADEVPDPHNLRVRLWVNDTLRQDFNTSDMINGVEKLIEVSSSVSTLFPGDVIATGTHHKGLGPIQDGDRITLEIDRIGRITVNVADPLHRVW